LAPLCACVAIGVSFNAGRRFVLAHPNSLTNLRARPAAMDFGTSLMFLVLVGIALYFRRRPEIHKRVMVLACCSILLPAIGASRCFLAQCLTQRGFGDWSPSQKFRRLRAFFTTRSNTDD
jgi:hypothetical protein